MAGILADSGWQALRRGKRPGLGQHGRRDDGYLEQRVPPEAELDALVIGAGFSGLYQLLCLRDRLGLCVKALEGG